jgi:hypothetical protein
MNARLRGAASPSGEPAFEPAYDFLGQIAHPGGEPAHDFLGQIAHPSGEPAHDFLGQIARLMIFSVKSANPARPQ